MVHIIGATTTRQMWKQLTLVKEARGRLGILSTCRALYRTTAEEGFNLVDHISKLWRYQEELHLMGSVVADEDFAMILVSSLPESSDLRTSAYLGSKTDGLALTLYELIAILLEEYR
jgi:gag-polypeptide of LTR copia-type